MYRDIQIRNRHRDGYQQYYQHIPSVGYVCCQSFAAFSDTVVQKRNVYFDMYHKI